MLIGYNIRSLGDLSKKGFADLLRKYAILDESSVADNIAEVVSRGFEVNVFAKHLNRKGELDTHGIQYTAIDIQDNGQGYSLFSAVDFKLELVYNRAKSVIVLQPTEYITIPTENYNEFLPAIERGLVKAYRGAIMNRLFSDEFSLEFS